MQIRPAPETNCVGQPGQTADNFAHHRLLFSFCRHVVPYIEHLFKPRPSFVPGRPQPWQAPVQYPEQ
jgi:hypothetical protein